MEINIQPIPANMVYEEFGGNKYYRKGYRQVLLGLKSEEEIMGSRKSRKNITANTLLYEPYLIIN